MEESIVFDPLIDERSLDREASKVDQRLEQSGTITPDLDDSQLGDVQLDGVGGVSGGGGGVGGGEAAGAAALASKIPKPIAGVAVSAAIPVALGGAVGAGMLSAMHSASARLQTSTSMIGQAWSMFWRPFGNRLDELFIRDLATYLLSTMVEFNDLAQNEGLLVGVAWLAGEAESGLANAVGGAVEGGLETIGIDMDIGGTVSDFLRNVSWLKAIGGPGAFSAAIGEALVKTIGAPNIGVDDLLSRIDWPTIGGAPLIGALAFNPVTAPLLVGALTFDRVTGQSLLEETFGDVSIGDDDILGDIFGDVSIGMRDLRRWLTGGRNGGNGDGDGDGNGDGDDFTPFPQLDTNPTGPGVGGMGTPSPRDPTDHLRELQGSPTSGGGLPGGPGPGVGGGMQRGGVVSGPTRTTVGEAGAEVVQPLSEFERMVDRIVSASSGGGEVDTQPIERKLDRLHRDLRALADEMASMTIEVDGETLGRATTNARHTMVFDSDSLI